MTVRWQQNANHLHMLDWLVLNLEETSLLSTGRRVKAIGRIAEYIDNSPGDVEFAEKFKPIARRIGDKILDLTRFM